MTTALTGSRLAERINEEHPGVALEWNERDVWVEPQSLETVARLLRDDEKLDFNFLIAVTGVDYIEHFELVYHLASLRRNHSAVLKARVYGRHEPVVPSVVEVWKGADLQEREVWDLMGVRFEGHPNMKRILLWEDFPGHPLRKDYLD